MTSVAAAAPASTMAPAAAAFNVVMVRTAASACSAVALPRLIAVAIKPGADRLRQEQPLARGARSSCAPGASASANPSATIP